MRVLVVSIPRSGTRFWLYLLQQILGIEAEYEHFGCTDDESMREIITRADVIVVPRRSIADIRESWGEDYVISRGKKVTFDDCLNQNRKLMPLLIAKRAHFVDTEKSATTIYQLSILLADLGVLWTDRASAFFREWPKIGSKHDGDLRVDRVALESARKSRAVL